MSITQSLAFLGMVTTSANLRRKTAFNFAAPDDEEEDDDKELVGADMLVVDCGWTVSTELCYKKKE